MGPAFASKYTADHLVWAQNWPQTLLLMVLYGPITGPTCAADGLAQQTVRRAQWVPW